MKSTEKHQSFAEALCKQEPLASDSYSAHRFKIAKSLERLSYRERMARRVLASGISVWLVCLVSVMFLGRLPQEVRRQSWLQTSDAILEFLFMITSFGCPVLLLIYLLRHLPNWWYASRRRNEALLLQIIDEQQRALSSRDSSQASIDP